MLDRMSKILDRLREITDGCSVDMHEPDENGVSAVVIGNNLDNAFGETVFPEGQEQYQEFVVRITKDGVTENFNLADLIALARF